MSTAFVVEATRSTPYINLDIESGTAMLKGSSYPENASQFYQPFFDGMEQAIQEMGTGTPASFSLELEIIYLNSSSSKVFMMLFDMLDEAAAKGLQTSITWRYHPENESAHECGEEFKEDLQHVPFTMLEVPDLPDF